MILFFFTAEYYPIVYMHICIIHPSVEGHLGCFRLLAIVTRDTEKKVLFQSLCHKKRQLFLIWKQTLVFIPWYHVKSLLSNVQIITVRKFLIVRRTLNIHLNYTYYKGEDNRKEIGTELSRTKVEK